MASVSMTLSDQITRISYGCCSCWNWSGGLKPTPQIKVLGHQWGGRAHPLGEEVTPPLPANRTLLWIQHVRLPNVSVALLVPFSRIWRWNIVILIYRLGLLTLPIYNLCTTCTSLTSTDSTTWTDTDYQQQLLLTASYDSMSVFIHFYTQPSPEKLYRVR